MIAAARACFLHVSVYASYAKYVLRGDDARAIDRSIDRSRDAESTDATYRRVYDECLYRLFLERGEGRAPGIILSILVDSSRFTRARAFLSPRASCLEITLVKRR